MDMELKEQFEDLWRKYFNGADLPMIFYYSDHDMGAKRMKAPSGHQCVIALLAQVRKGTSICLDRDSIGCPGGRRYLGFSMEIMPNFEYFLSYGIPGKLEGERYKKDPELVNRYMAQVPRMQAPAKFIIFKRWDALEESDEPAVVIFFAKPDVLSGLFTLANFDEPEQHMVVAPFGAGCATIVQYPFLEAGSERPRCFIGMFDVSARPYVPADTLSFAAPMSKFRRMVENMEESFLITSSWNRVYNRIRKSSTPFG
jgi:uncharacterized protein (DUF169 family)